LAKNTLKLDEKVALLLEELSKKDKNFSKLNN
jgi:hypothetical protein